jgi:deazaflavin-dependent oxidoreductase (nitroreductase family)
MSLAIVLAAMAASAAGFAAWRQDPRIGSGFVNRVIDPVLLERGLSGVGRSEIGTIEHIGRRSGTRRLTPVHPVATDQGFRIIVPLGGASQWARNVLAAGHCRLQLHDIVYELDEPALVEPASVPDLPAVVRVVSAGLGFRYLTLRRRTSSSGSVAEQAILRPEGRSVAAERAAELETVAS